MYVASTCAPLSPRSCSTWAWTRSYASRVKYPRPIPDWFDTTITGTSASFSVRIASAAPGTSRTSSGREI
jgi:hypothetical protein